MSDTTIPALLEELREVDADTYREIQKRLLHYMIAPQMDAPIVLDHIQGCIQRATAAKPGWSLISNQYNFGGNRPVVFQAAILIKRYVNGEELKEPVSILRQEKESLAAAILAAYIEAVRASK